MPSMISRHLGFPPQSCISTTVPLRCKLKFCGVYLRIEMFHTEFQGIWEEPPCAGMVFRGNSDLTSVPLINIFSTIWFHRNISISLANKYRGSDLGQLPGLRLHKSTVHTLPSIFDGKVCTGVHSHTSYSGLIAKNKSK